MLRTRRVWPMHGDQAALIFGVRSGDPDGECVAFDDHWQLVRTLQTSPYCRGDLLVGKQRLTPRPGPGSAALSQVRPRLRWRFWDRRTARDRRCAPGMAGGNRPRGQGAWHRRARCRRAPRCGSESSRQSARFRQRSLHLPLAQVQGTTSHGILRASFCFDTEFALRM